MAVLISGRGTNLQAIIDGIKGGEINATIEIVISNNPNAYGLERAKQANIPTKVIDHREFSTREDHEHAILSVLAPLDIDLIVLAGYMRILTPLFIRPYYGRIINIHPALLPAFPGTHAQKQALEYGVRISGCTTHFVDEGTDTGPIILQKAVYVRQDDTEETLSQRILKYEHILMKKTIQLFCEGRLTLDGRKVIIEGIKSIEELGL